MKKISLLLVTLISFVSCKSDETKIKDYFKETANDPSSLVIYKIEEQPSDVPGEKLYGVDYGAKNSFGGMMRDVALVRMANDTIKKVESYREKKIDEAFEKFENTDFSEYSTSDAERIIDSAAAVTEAEMN